MPNIFEMFKDYVIESEDDIPQKYKEEIEKRLNLEYHTEHSEPAKIISGKRGKTILEESKIEDIFQSNHDFYLGHGTSGGEEVISSILENGLMTVNPEAIKAYSNTLRGLDSTTIAFGEGTESLFSEQRNLLDNWPHKDSKNVVIVSIPKKYALRNTEVGLADLYEPFYIGSIEEGYKLRPEFIKGIYNADSHAFTPNDNFYQNLKPEQQKELFDSIRQKYIELYAEHSIISPETVKKPLPLNETEIEQVTIEWYKVQLERLRRDKTFQPDMLDEDLQEITSETLMSDFDNATRAIREDAQQELEDDKDNSEEGWSLDDWE